MRTTTVSPEARGLLANAQPNPAKDATSKGAGKAGSPAPATSQTRTAEQIAKVSPGLAKAHDRLDVQAQAAVSSMSKLGQYKSALDGLGSAAKGLAALGAGSAAPAMQSAIEKFVAAYNASVKSGSAVAGDSSVNDAGVNRTQRELRSALTQAGGQAGGSSALSKLGLSLHRDGTLAFDAKAFAASTKDGTQGAMNTLIGLGKSIGEDSAQALASGGRLNASMTHLQDRALSLKQQQSAVLDVASKLAQSGGSPGSWSNSLLKAYASNG